MSVQGSSITLPTSHQRSFWITIQYFVVIRCIVTPNVVPSLQFQSSKYPVIIIKMYPRKVPKNLFESWSDKLFAVCLKTDVHQLYNYRVVLHHHAHNMTTQGFYVNQIDAKSNNDISSRHSTEAQQEATTTTGIYTWSGAYHLVCLHHTGTLKN